MCSLILNVLIRFSDGQNLRLSSDNSNNVYPGEATASSTKREKGSVSLCSSTVNGKQEEKGKTCSRSWRLCSEVQFYITVQSQSRQHVKYYFSNIKPSPIQFVTDVLTAAMWEISGTAQTADG